MTSSELLIMLVTSSPLGFGRPRVQDPGQMPDESFGSRQHNCTSRHTIIYYTVDIIHAYKVSLTLESTSTHNPPPHPKKKKKIKNKVSLATILPQRLVLKSESCIPHK